MLIGFFVVQWPTGVAAKFFIIVLLSLVASVVVYELLVRCLKVLRVLFGMTRLPQQKRAVGGSSTGRLSDRPAVNIDRTIYSA